MTMVKPYQEDSGKAVLYNVTVCFSNDGSTPVHRTIEAIPLEEVATHLEDLEDEFEILTVCLSRAR